MIVQIIAEVRQGDEENFRQALADYGLILFHTDTFWTSGEVKFYGE